MSETMSRDPSALAFRLIEVGGNHSFTAAHLTLSGGDDTSGNGGGAIYNNSSTGGTVRLTDSTVSDNSAVGGVGGGIANGDGVYGNGAVRLIDSTVSGNNAGVDGVGGGIYNNGALTLTNSTVSDNAAGIGGGIANDDGGRASITNSTISGNNANTSGYGGGGAIFVGSAVTITNSTLSGNRASDGGEIYIAEEAVTLISSIVANSPSGEKNCNGPYATDGGYNLDSDGSCGLSRSTDKNKVAPQLGPLQDNGGPTQTLLPAATSPAIGVVRSSPPTVVNGVQICPRTDQRGVASFGKCTIGSVDGGFLISTSALPSATPGKDYKPVKLTAQEVGTSSHPYKTTLTWGQQAVALPATALPKGMTLSMAGFLAGTPSKTLRAEHSSIKVKVTETVTAVKGTKKVSTKKTVEATIPLTIT